MSACPAIILISFVNATCNTFCSTYMFFFLQQTASIMVVQADAIVLGRLELDQISPCAQSYIHACTAAAVWLL